MLLQTQGDSEDEDVETPLATYDDTGVDQVGDLEEILPDDADERGRYDDFRKQLKPWTPSEIDIIKESIIEGGNRGHAAGFSGFSAAVNDGR